ncbi:T9SS type B sorting domain-containing protein [Tellurirhabdus rosea]|uniref:T9SS type B sorting domain-containing protein n=1 Tax=Tellurirhabdus rosea TaxID=2674997 RepID=UPI002251C7F9|nr:gliding motility-associated C-terminal domain-containing protein [Tellurirhabdus rosea]
MTTQEAVVKNLFTQPGQYLVSLVRTVNGVAQAPVDTTIQIDMPPPAFQNWRNDTMICQQQSIVLDPYPQGKPAGAKFLWYPKGDTTQTLTVDSSGCYSVQVIMPNGCTYEDKINVKVCGEQPQSQGAKWYFGNNAGLDFSGGGSPRPIDDSKINTPEGTSSISNSKGKLQFYTDGIVIYDRDGNRMRFLNPADSGSLGGSPNSSQSALIVPQPVCKGCEYLYHVYTTSDIQGTKTLTYSVVDMRRNGGKGMVVQRNVPLAPVSSERLASVRNDRDTTYWVLTRDFGNNTFRVYHMTPAGLSDPRTYQLGPEQTDPAQGEGYLKIGPADTSGNGNRPVAMVVPGPPNNYVELYTFNDSTGTLTAGPRVDLGPVPPYAYGVEFSPNGQKMYISYRKGDGPGADTTASMIISYDISRNDAQAITDSRSVLDSTRTREYGALQIGSDGRIYVAIKDGSSLGVIDNPNDEVLAGATFTPNGVSLGGKTSQLGLPSFVANFNEPSNSPAFSYADTCAGEPTTFSTSPRCDPLKDQYVWNYGDNTAPVSTTANQVQHTYQQPGRYTVSLKITTLRSDGSVCKDTLISQQIQIVRKPDEIDLGADFDSCRTSVTLDAGVDATEYYWYRNRRLLRGQTGRTLTVFTPGAAGSNGVTPGQFIVIAANGGCYQTDTINVILRRPPAFSLGPDTTFCAKSSVVLSARGASWESYQWSNGQTTRDITVNQVGTYSVLVKNAQGCENRDTIRVASRPSPVVTGLQRTPPSSCTVADGTISLTVTGARRFDWTTSTGAPAGAPSDTTNTIRNLANGLYRVRITGQNSCVTDTSFQLQSDTTGFVNLGPDRGRCIGDTALLQSLTRRQQGDVFLWSTGATTPTLEVRQPGTYRLTIVNQISGCRGSDEVTISFISRPEVEVGPPIDVCTNQRTFRLTGQTPVGGVWSGRGVDSTGRFTPADSLIGTTPLVLTYTVNQAGCVNTDRKVIFLQRPPTISLGPDTTLCPTPDLQLRVNAGNTATYQWSNGSTTASIRPQASGPYSVTALVGACSVSDTVQITFKPLPLYTLTTPVPLCVGDNQIATVRVTPTTNSQRLTYLWRNANETTPSITVSRIGDYAVAITNDVGCTAQDTAQVLDLCEPRVVVPDAFTPNGDGSNDFLDIFHAYVVEFELKIYNRWGEVIFVSRDPEQKWDGMYRGEKYPPMVYAYTVSYKSFYYPERPPVLRRGSVLLIR